MQLITEATPTGAHGGYHCPTCECTLKDSEAYLDHINGKRHQRKLGFSMRVEAATVEAVRARIDYWRRADAHAKRDQDSEGARAEAVAEYEGRVARQEEEEARRKRARKEKGKGEAKHAAAAKHSVAAPGPATGTAVGTGDGEGDGAPGTMSMEEMMGFAGFGGGKA